MKTVGGIIVALAVIFLLIGVFVPTVAYEHKITVNASLEKSFSVFISDSRLGEWLTGFVSLELTGGEPETVGSTYRVVTEENGEEIVMNEVVTAFIKNERFTHTLENDVLMGEIDARFSGDSTGTEIAVMTQFTGKNMLWRSILPLFKSMMIEQAQNDFNKLKEIIESTPDEMEELTAN